MPACSARADRPGRWPAALAAGLLVLALAGCSTLPPPAPQPASYAMRDTADTRLGVAVLRQLRAHPGLSGLVPFEDPLDALAARLLLAETADRSIDAQYFIWNGDTVGMLLWQALWQAAERGVRVRLLLDDANTSGLDPVLSALDAHPLLELRLYNPFVERGWLALRWSGALTGVFIAQALALLLYGLTNASAIAAGAWFGPLHWPKRRLAASLPD